MSSTDKRHGPSISVKMIATTTALIVLIIAGFGFLNIWTIGRVFDTSVAEKERLIEEQLRKVGNATVTAVASSSRSFLETNNDFDLRHYVADLAKKDSSIASVYVLDANQGLIAHSDEAKNPKEGHPKLAEDSWGVVYGVWKQRKERNEPEPLVASEAKLAAGRMALFAAPVFPAGVPAVAAGVFDPNEATRPLGFVVIAYGFGELDRAIAQATAQKEAAKLEAGYRTAD